MSLTDRTTGSLVHAAFTSASICSSSESCRLNWSRIESANSPSVRDQLKDHKGFLTAPKAANRS
jgi:hypothetical protein